MTVDEETMRKLKTTGTGLSPKSPLSPMSPLALCVAAVALFVVFIHRLTKARYATVQGV